jgi:hypothetical protein
MQHEKCWVTVVGDSNFDVALTTVFGCGYIGVFES